MSDDPPEVLGMQMERWCAECAAQVAFVEFDCDDHVEDCLELVCTLCGAGYEGALADAGVAPRRGRSTGSSQPAQRRSA